MNALSLRCPRSPRRQAPRALRERLECSEGGDTGRRTRGSYRVGALTPVRPSVQPPAGVERKGALYARPARKGKAIEARLEGQREGLAGPWISSASRTASSTPSRICLSPGPLAAGALRR